MTSTETFLSTLGYNVKLDAAQTESMDNAIELAGLAWDYYEAGNDKYDAASIFEYSDESPNEAAVLGAYVEGMLGQLGLI